ncbi:MAG: hypothetical protein K1X72_09155 [Pyrinomonadaceae bacterium]|nr:hypothetical protein [Pyrinomonadaceae bacterium]
MQFDWEDNFEIEVKIDKNTVLLWANKEGLISLANHLLNYPKTNFQAVIIFILTITIHWKKVLMN